MTLFIQWDEESWEIKLIGGRGRQFEIDFVGKKHDILQF
jgi:hypothetical protein